MWHNFVEVNNICMYKKKREEEKIGEKKVKDQRKTGINRKGNQEERIKRGMKGKNMLKGM